METEPGYARDAHPSIPDVHVYDKRLLRVVCMGAGFSGLYMSLLAEKRLENVEFVVYEKNSDLGGTWLVNRYPGCACDVPAPSYVYSFEPNLWEGFYAGAKEIHAYLRKFTDKYDVEKYIKYNTEIVSAEWKQDTTKWIITVKSGSQITEDVCDIFVNAGGVLE